MIIHGPPDHLHLSYFQAYQDERLNGHHAEWREMPYSLIEFSVDGSWLVEYEEGEVFRFDAGIPFFVPAGTRHKLSLPGDVRKMQTRWCFFRIEKLPGRDIFQDYDGGPEMPHDTGVKCVELIKRTLENQCEQGILNTVVQYELVFSLIKHVLPLCRAKTRQNSETLLRLQPVLDFVENNLQRDFGIEELAEVMSLSPSRMQNVFKELLGVPPWTYVIERRISAAQELLHKTDMRVDEIAFKTGFKSQFYFSRIFSKKVGLSPSAFRRLVQKN